MSFLRETKERFTSKPPFMSSKGHYSPSLSSSDEGSSSSFVEKSVPFGSLRRSIWQRYRSLLIAHFILFIIYGLTIYLVATRKELKFSRKHGLPFSPAIEALEFSEQTFTLEARVQEQGSFSGKPSATLDKAWHDLLDPENIRLEPEIMAHYGRLDSGVALPDGDGYIGVLNVYHELHCLKRIHQYMYQEHYWPDLDDNMREMNRLHNEHCIDFLRQASMCHGDIGLLTFEWNERSRIPVAKATTHQCVNWEKLNDWTKSRTVDMMKPGWLVHPKLGVAYPDGKGDSIGAVKIPEPGNAPAKSQDKESDASTGY
ncbi:hypothetical protein WAI453_000614 [Rhynchosporium graminicola]|uniref:Tat pathway signal sequence n=1 Tax=Rhynchosporium graminicola TaxID=2792576 RepID=A0A1E1JVD5_9HELO|nr:uncharacterized protein RCO7_01157 [Rhynchosporium commune]